MKATEPWYLLDKVNLGASVKATTGGNNDAIRRGNLYHAAFYRALRLEWLLNHGGDEEPWELLIEPWYRTRRWKLRSPDAVLINRVSDCAIILEVKMNWANGRDTKLLGEYLPLVQEAHKLSAVFPCMVVGNLRGYPHKPLLSMAQIFTAQSWRPGQPTPALLHLKKVT